MKGNANIQPIKLFKFSQHNPKAQIRWNIVISDNTDEDGNTFESWDYEWVNVNSVTKDELVNKLSQEGHQNPESYANEILAL